MVHKRAVLDKLCATPVMVDQDDFPRLFQKLRILRQRRAVRIHNNQHSILPDDLVCLLRRNKKPFILLRRVLYGLNDL